MGINRSCIRLISRRVIYSLVKLHLARKRIRNLAAIAVLNRVMRRTIIIVCLFLAVGVSLVLLAKRGGAAMRSSTAQDTSLLLLGVTNVPTGSFAVFCLSNGTRRHVVCVPEAFEQAGAGAWNKMRS